MIPNSTIVSRLLYYLLILSQLHHNVSLSQRQTTQVRGVQVHPVPLRRSDPASPYCFAASSISDLGPGTNFLATQVWPSARVAAIALEEHADPQWTICEFGCGPGLPSLTAASRGCSVYATDIDDLGLEMVDAAAAQQGLLVETRRFDLIQGITGNENSWLNSVDLVVFSDVFESATVARGAARLSHQFLENGVKVWAFTQSDRAQRDAFLETLRDLYPAGGAPLDELSFSSRPYDPSSKLWLCDVDETAVMYG